MLAFIIFATSVADVEGDDWLRQALIVEGRDREIDGGCFVAQTKDAVHLKVGVSLPYLFGCFCEVLHHDHELANSQCVLGHGASNTIILIPMIYLERGAVLSV